METILSGTKITTHIGTDHRFVIIGQRINPSWRPKLMEEMARGDFSRVEKEALRQITNGAQVLDISADIPDSDERQILSDVIRFLQSIVDIPLMISSSNPATLHAGIQAYQGKPLVNSVNGSKDSISKILPIVAEFNTAVIGVCSDEDGIPDDPRARFGIARRIVETAESLGISRQDVIIDPVIMPVSARPDSAHSLFKIVRYCTEELGVNTCCGANNISFGLPERDILNATFLSMAISAGLTCALTDPTHPTTRMATLASDAFMGRDPDFENWLLINERGAKPKIRRAERLARKQA